MWILNRHGAFTKDSDTNVQVSLLQLNNGLAQQQNYPIAPSVVEQNDVMGYWMSLYATNGPFAPPAFIPQSPSKSDKTIAIALGVSAGVLVLAVLIGLVLRYRRRSYESIA